MKFSDFGFKKFINDALSEINFITPTSIQEKVIPILKKNKSVIAQAHTGTGKTHAFLLPIINNLDIDNFSKTQFIIFSPTRELSNQIYLNIKMIIKNTPFTVSNIVGGKDFNKQSSNLQSSQPTIIVGTPTRIRKLYEQNSLNITTSKYAVIDECDMVFELGFIEDVDFILTKMSKNLVISSFSATISNSLKPFLTKYFSSAEVIEDSTSLSTNKNIEHILVWTKNRETKEVLKNIIENINPYICIIFVNKKSQISELSNWMKEMGLNDVAELHGDLSPRQRDNTQKRISKNEYKWLIATDVASRGIDIDGVSHIISLDFPKEIEYYIHRSGRTGRSGYTGKSYILSTSDNQNKIDFLKSKKITFSNYKLSNGILVETIDKKKEKKLNNVTNIDEQKIIGKYKHQKVKPGYKKKRKNEIEKLKKDIRRKHIKESISNIKKDKYKKRRKEIFGDE